MRKDVRLVVLETSILPAAPFILALIAFDKLWEIPENILHFTGKYCCTGIVWPITKGLTFLVATLIQ
jgi:hypothetical protein